MWQKLNSLTRNWSLGTKLVITMGMVIALGVFAMGQLYFAMREVSHVIDKELLVAEKALAEIHAANEANVVMGAEMYLFALTGSAEAAARKEQADEDFGAAMERATNLIKTLPQNEELLAFAVKVEEADGLYCHPNETKAMELFDSGKQKEALVVVTGDYASGRAAFSKVIDEFLVAMDEYVQMETDKMAAIRAEGERKALVGVAALVAFGFPIAILFARKVRLTIEGMSRRLGSVLEENLQELINGVNAIASGDLTREIRPLERGNIIRRKDEFGVLSRMLGKFISDTEGALSALIGCQARLRELVAGVRERSESVARTSDELSHATHSTFESAESIAESTKDVLNATTHLAETSTGLANVSENISSEVNAAHEAMAQLEATVESVVEQSQEQIRLVGEATNRATTGGESVESAINSLERIASQVNATASVIQDLGEQQARIGNIVSMIREISAQTNLLALNAAIESARAGEHGRGFSVVADEVRKLAERTNQATEDISHLITSVSLNVEKAMGAMDITITEVAQGSEQSAEAKVALGSIVKAIDDVRASAASFKSSLESTIAQSEVVRGALAASNQASAEGASTSQQMSAVSEEISASAQVVSNDLDKQRSDFTRIESAARDLAHQAEMLEESVSIFKVAVSESSPLKLAA